MASPHPGRIARIVRRSVFSLSVVALAAWTAAACGAEAAAKTAPAYQDVLIKHVPFIVQEPDFCGEACAAMYLQKLGRKVDQDYVFNQSGLDPLQGRGCYTKELAAALTKIGFRIGPVWHRMPAREAAQAVESQWRAVHADLLAGIPTDRLHALQRPAAARPSTSASCWATTRPPTR